MNIALQTTSASEGTFIIEIIPDDYAQQVDNAIREYNKKISLKGFRKGHIPHELVRRRYGKEILERILYEISANAIDTYIKDKGLILWEEPLLLYNNPTDALQPDYQQKIQLKWCCALIPEIDWSNLADIQQTTYTIKGISEESVSSWVNEFLKRYGHIETVSKSEQHVDLTQGILIGENNFKKDFYLLADANLGPNNPSLLGLHPNDTILLTLSPTIPYVIPDTYVREEEAALYDQTLNLLKTLEGTYTYTITAIHRPVPTTLDTAFFKRIFPQEEITTVEKFKEILTKTIINHVQEIADELSNYEMKKNILEKVTIAIPTNFINQKIAQTYFNEPETWLLPIQQMNASNFCWEAIKCRIRKEQQIKITENEFLDQLKKQYTESLKPRKIPGMESAPTPRQRQAIHDRLVEEKIFASLKNKITIHSAEKTVEEFDTVLREKKPLTQILK